MIKQKIQNYEKSTTIGKMKLRTDLISAYNSKELSEALTEHLKDSIRDFFSKFEVPSLADKESCLSIAFDEDK